MDVSELVIFLMECIGTVAFSVSGATVAIEAGMDVFGVCILGIVTAVGGGMVRDVILGQLPVTLVRPVYVIIAAVTALSLFAFLYFRRKCTVPPRAVLRERILLVMDAIGLGVFTVMGMVSGIRAGYGDNGFLLVFLGVLTGVGGGVMRDTMAGFKPYIFVRHIYALSSLFGAILFRVLFPFAGEAIAMIPACISVVAIRVLAASFRWNLPKLPPEKRS